MCAVSAVTDYYRDKWIQPTFMPTLYPGYPVLPPLVPDTKEYVLKPGVTITQDQWVEYLELKRRMEIYDAENKQPDCIKPEVAEWEKVVKESVGG